MDATPDPDLAALLAEHARAAGVPGASVAVLRDGALHVASTGVADVRATGAVTPETRFPIASVTKPMVATAIAMLIEASTVAADDPIERHVPELRGTDWAARATIGHLLSMRAGVPMRTSHEFAFDDRHDDPLARFCAALADQPASTEPGTAWSYGNTGYSVLGRAIETATGSSWLDAMRSLVFDPYGMRACGARAEAAEAVSGHIHAEDGPAPAQAWESPGLGPGGAVLWTTASDLARFARPHVDGAFELMRAPAPSPRIWPWMDRWCHGWGMLDWAGGPCWGWDGVTTGARAQLRIIPSERGAIALLSNSDRGRALYWSLVPVLAREYFSVTVTAPPRPGAIGDLMPFEGVYAWPDRRIEVTADADRLRLRIGDEQVEALPEGDRTFRLQITSPDPLTVTFAPPGEDGASPMLYWVVWGHPRETAAGRS